MLKQLEITESVAVSEPAQSNFTTNNSTRFLSKDTLRGSCICDRNNRKGTVISNLSTWVVISWEDDTSLSVYSWEQHLEYIAELSLLDTPPLGIGLNKLEEMANIQLELEQKLKDTKEAIAAQLEKRNAIASLLQDEEASEEIQKYFNVNGMKSAKKHLQMEREIEKLQVQLQEAQADRDAFYQQMEALKGIEHERDRAVYSLEEYKIRYEKLAESYRNTNVKELEEKVRQLSADNNSLAVLADEAQEYRDKLDEVIEERDLAVYSLEEYKIRYEKLAESVVSPASHSDEVKSLPTTSIEVGVVVQKADGIVGQVSYVPDPFNGIVGVKFPKGVENCHVENLKIIQKNTTPEEQWTGVPKAIAFLEGITRSSKNITWQKVRDACSCNPEYLVAIQGRVTNKAQKQLFDKLPQLIAEYMRTNDKKDFKWLPEDIAEKVKALLGKPTYFKGDFVIDLGNNEVKEVVEDDDGTYVRVKGKNEAPIHLEISSVEPCQEVA